MKCIVDQSDYAGEEDAPQTSYYQWVTFFFAIQVHSYYSTSGSPYRYEYTATTSGSPSSSLYRYTATTSGSPFRYTATTSGSPYRYKGIQLLPVGHLLLRYTGTQLLPVGHHTGIQLLPVGHLTAMQLLPVGHLTENIIFQQLFLSYLIPVGHLKSFTLKGHEIFEPYIFVGQKTLPGPHMNTQKRFRKLFFFISPKDFDYKV